MKGKRWWRDEEEENLDVNGCSDNIISVKLHYLAGYRAITLLRPSMVKKINSGIREIWTKLCVICRNFLLYKLTVELFPVVSSCRISTSSISLNFACTCLQFRSEISVTLGNERGLEPMTTLETRVRIEWDHHMFSTNQLFVSCLKTKLYEKPFTIWKFIAGTTLVTRLNP